MIIHKFEPQRSNSPTVTGAAAAAASASETTPATSPLSPPPPVLPHEPPPNEPPPLLKMIGKSHHMSLAPGLLPPPLPPPLRLALEMAAIIKKKRTIPMSTQNSPIPPPSLSGSVVGIASVFNARDIDVPFLGQRVEQRSNARGHRF